MGKGLNLMMPGNPRYQPKGLVPYFGYDNLYHYLADVEIATIEVLFEIGVIPKATYRKLTPTRRLKLLGITTTEVDGVEREVTKHDVRAWVKIAQGIVGPDLGRWVHVPLTSYDGLDTANILRLKMAYENVNSPAIASLVSLLADKVEEYAGVIQIGRTHKQHALPITAGFWLATILSRLITNWEAANFNSLSLRGKISGAVGAYNAQVGLGFMERCGFTSFEERVLLKLGLQPARIGTQILPPETYTYFLFSCSMISATLGQLGRDCRNLMASEIMEVSEPFEVGQVGSSTMAHKRNPITFENLEGTWLESKIAWGYLQELQISDNQRDLVGSRLIRNLPIFQIHLQHQLDSLLRKSGTHDRPFISRVVIDSAVCKKNFKQSSRFILAEPLYIALQMAGYNGDAHHLVNHVLMPIAQAHNISLASAICHLDPYPNHGYAPEVEAWGRVPEEIKTLLESPEKYTGDAKKKALEIVQDARNLLATKG